MKRDRGVRPWWIFLLGTSAVAVVSLLFHSLRINPQVDTQMMTYAFQFLQAVQTGTLGEFFLTVHKYPLLPSFVLAAAYGCLFLVLLATGRVPSIDAFEFYLYGSPVEMIVLSRLMIVACVALILLLLPKISRRILPSVSPFAASILFLSSLLVLLFATAVRPHIPVTAAILFCFFRSLKLAEEKTMRNECFAFASAAIAFCTLQSGLFALLFVLWGFASVHGSLQWKRLMLPRLFVWLVLFAVVSVFIGYPFLLNIPMGHPIHLTFDLGNNYIEDQWKWNGHGFTMLFTGVFGSDPFLFLFAAAGIFSFFRSRHTLFSPFGIILVFLFAYILCFGLYTGTSTRFFLPILPFLALLGAPALGIGALSNVVWVFIAMMHVRMAMLGFRPNTFDLTRAYLLQHGSGSIVSDFPHYFLGIPPTKASIGQPRMARERFIAALPADLPDARDFERNISPTTMFVLRTALLPPPSGTDFRLCAQADSGPSKEWIFLWQEVSWGFLKLWNTEHQGPAITIYCRISSFNSPSGNRESSPVSDNRQGR